LDDSEAAKKKKFKASRITKIFKTYPFVPLFGDMPIALSSIYGRASQGNSKFDLTEYDLKEAKENYALKSSLEQHRSQYTDFLLKFTILNDEVPSLKF
jgi:hypothetical protein